MLIEFSLENFRSVRTRETLSMVAAPRIHKKGSVIKPQIIGESKFPPLLKALAIYGPNASGKSTLVKGLQLLKQLVSLLPTAENRPLPVSPFRFDLGLLEKPSIFEVHFIENKIRYSFELALTADRIHWEKMTLYEKGEPRLLYERSYSNGTDLYKFPHLEGGSELHEAWRKLTGPRTLFLAQAVANSNEELIQLKTPYKWLTKLMIESDGMKPASRMTQKLIADHPSFGTEVAKLLSNVDIPILSIQSKRYEEEEDSLKTLLTNNIQNGVVPGERALKRRVTNQISTSLTHLSNLGEAVFDFDEESEGTKNLLGFALPWLIFRDFDTEKEDAKSVLVVDELDSSLHPKLLEALVQKHIESELDSQLIFTTHDTHLMDSKFLRRDQIWMTERDFNGATHLRSVYDFEGREGEDVEKRYYEGRYRSLPLIKKEIKNESDS